MKRILATSEEEFFNLYLKVNESDEGELYDEMDFYIEKFKEMTKPKKYPCIILYYHYLYQFVYESDFKDFTSVNNDI